MVKEIKMQNESVNYPTRKVILFSLIMFLYLFNIKFLAVQWMPTGRFVFLLTFIFFGLGGCVYLKKEIERYPLYFLSLFFVLIYIAVQFLYNGGVGFDLISRLIVFCVLSLFMAIMVSLMFNNTKLFIQSIAVACLVQSIFVYISFLSPDYRYWLSTVLVESSNIPLTYAKRVPGFSNASGSSFSVSLSMGVFSLMYLYYESSRLREKAIYFFGALFIMSSCIFVAKLGVLLSFYFILAVLFLEFIKKPIFVIKAILIGILSGFIVINYLEIGAFGELSYAINRTFSLFLGNGDSTLTALNAMPIPELDVNTIVGFGIVTLNGVNLSGSDIGYVQSFYSLGLIFSLFFYVPLFLYLLAKTTALKNRTNAFLALILFFPLFFIELKEPFITKLGYSFILFTFLFITNNNEQKTSAR